MSSLDLWSRFIDRRLQKKPLPFVTGMRHSLPVGFHCGVHSHSNIEIVYHPSGRGVTRLRTGEVLPFDVGTVVLYGAREPHDQQLEPGSPGEDWCVQLAVPPGLRGMPHASLQVPDIVSSGLVDDIAFLSRRQAPSDPAERAIADLRATALLLGIVHLARLRGRQQDLSPAERHVLEAERYIGEHYDRIEPLQRVAEQVGVTSDHLRHLFQRLRGKSLARHRNDVRIARAKDLLINSRIPLKQVATFCGFGDEYYFSAVFRAATGMAPGRYRERHGLSPGTGSGTKALR